MNEIKYTLTEKDLNVLLDKVNDEIKLRCTYKGEYTLSIDLSKDVNNVIKTYITKNDNNYDTNN